MTVEAVLERYQQALSGVSAILNRVTLPKGAEITSGFDGSVSWFVTPKGASSDKATALDAVHCDADLQCALHQSDYFPKPRLGGRRRF
jgi:hypothetical protein